MTGHGKTPLWQRTAVLGYGVLAYLALLVTLLYYVGFLANLVPKGIDEGATVTLAEAVAVDLGLIVLFGLQHSVMARSRFKDRWTRLIPEAIERSTYVLTASVLLLAIAWLWRPIPTVLWDIDGPARWIFWGVFCLGVILVVVASFQINHAELWGLQQVYAFFRGRDPPEVPFQTPGLYRYVRHPLMAGLVLWFWATPHMTVGHLLFAAGFTGYILVGVRLEERMLIDVHGEVYREYRDTVPMLFPRPGRTVGLVSGERDTTSD